MNKFSILEAQNRYYGGGTPFSNSHRVKSAGGFLDNNKPMLDIDMIIYDNDSIKSIVEKKFKAISKMGNILKDEKSYQRDMLLNTCNMLDAKLFINITSDDTYYHISNDGIKEYSSKIFTLAKNKYLTYESDDSVFIEYRWRKPAAIMKRMTDNINIDGLLDKMSKSMNIDVFRVDDHSDNTKIKFYKFNNTFIGEVDILQNESERYDIEKQWVSVYKKMGI